MQITFHGLDPSPAVEALCRECVDKLEKVYPRLIRCLVTVELPHTQHRKGNQFHVRVELSVPGQDIVVSQDPGRDEKHEDAYLTIRDAFRAARRQLEDHARKMRGETKTHGTPGGDSMSSMAAARRAGIRHPS